MGSIRTYSVAANLRHSWAGDLDITLQHVGYGNAASVVDRVGRSNNGLLSWGDSSDFGGTYSFNNDYSGDLWAAAAGEGMFDTIPGGNYFPTDAKHRRETAFSDVWNGQTVAGSWILKITDAALLNTGSLGSWDIRFLTNDPAPPLPPDPVETPEPATTAMLASGMAGLLLLARSTVRRQGRV